MDGLQKVAMLKFWGWETFWELGSFAATVIFTYKKNKSWLCVGLG